MHNRAASHVPTPTSSTASKVPPEIKALYAEARAKIPPTRSDVRALVKAKNSLPAVGSFHG